MCVERDCQNASESAAVPHGVCGGKTKNETFMSKVGIEPPSTPLLGFQGSRGSRRIKVIINQAFIVPLIYPDFLICVFSGTVRTHRRVLHCPMACADERSRGARSPG